MLGKKKIILEELSFPALKINKARIVTEVNSLAQNFGVKVGAYCWDTFGKRGAISQGDRNFFEKHNSLPEGGIMCSFCRADEALEKQEIIIENIKIGEDFWETYWIPIDGEHYIHFGKKVSGEKE